MTTHDGHRARMRERFRTEGLDGFADHEVLELLLFYARARGDVNPLSHTLIDTFGSLRGVLEARPDQLLAVKGVGEETAALLGLVVPLFRRYSAALSEETRRITSRAEAEAFCRALLIGRRTECFYVISLGPTGSVLARRKIAEGTANEVGAYPRLVAEALLNSNAHSALLCHNHPGGTPEPSAEDVRVTRQLEQLLGGMGITLLDHIVVSDAGCWSMAQHGQLSPLPAHPVRKRSVE